MRLDGKLQITETKFFRKIKGDRRVSSSVTFDIKASIGTYRFRISGGGYAVKKLNRHKEKRTPTLVYHLLSVPAVALSGMIVLIPAVRTIYSAFTDWNGVSSHMNWIGLRNFQELMKDWIFWKAVANNFKWTLIFLTIPMVISMFAAVLMARYHVGHKTFQAIYLIPYLLAPSTNAVIWQNIIFSPNAGLVGFLQGLGWNITSPLGNIDTALLGAAGVDIWHYWGYLAVVFLAALRQTPTDQLEAAKLEGANGVQTFIYIYMPSILPTVLMMTVFITIYSFMTYDYIFLLTSGGPAHATEVLSTYARTMAFSAFKFGKAAAISLVMGVFGSIAGFAYVWLSRKETLQ